MNDAPALAPPFAVTGHLFEYGFGADGALSSERNKMMTEVAASLRFVDNEVVDIEGLPCRQIIDDAPADQADRMPVVDQGMEAIAAGSRRFDAGDVFFLRQADT